MTVRKKAEKQPLDKSSAEEIIKRGGLTKADIDENVRTNSVRFTLRIPNDLMDQVDEERKSRVGTISRNQWILEAIVQTLATKRRKREKNNLTDRSFN